MRSQIALRGLLIAMFATALMLVPHTYAASPIVAQAQISFTPGQSEAPSLATRAGRLAAVWGERSTNQVGVVATWLGADWPQQTLLDTGTKAQYQWSGVAVDAQATTHIAYASGDSVFYRSQQASGAWSAPVQVATTLFANPTRMASANDGTLWIVWRDRDGTALFYRFSRDQGRSWQAGSDGGVVASEPGNMFGPAIAVGPDNLLHIVWYDRSGGDYRGAIRYADWNGSRFDTGNLSNDSRDIFDADPAITVDAQNVQHVAYRRGVSSSEQIIYARREAGGGWQGYTALASNLGDVKYAPAIATDEQSNIFVTYSQPFGTASRRIVLLVKPPSGDWEATPISNGPWDSRSAVVGIAVNGSVQAHIFYQHEVNIDDGEIEYARVQIAGQPGAPAPAAPQPAPAAPTPVAPTPDAFAAASPRAGCTYVAATQHNLCAGFRNYWQQRGGIDRYGNPISEDFVENGLTVQYFERTRFEYHPGAAPQEGDVLIGLLGTESTASRRAAGEAPFQPSVQKDQTDCTFVTTTQHNLCAGFRQYYERFGGLANFGYAISEEFVERGVTVQYFERARFEYHAGAQPQRFDVLLGWLGAERAAR